jgi:hypothetical protein
VSYASFTNSAASTKLPTHSVVGGRRVGKSRLAALLALAASTEFLLVAVAAYSAAVLYHRLIRLVKRATSRPPGGPGGRLFMTTSS